MPVPAFVLQIVNFLVGLAIISFMFTLVYKLVPDARLAWGDKALRTTWHRRQESMRIV